MKSIARDQFKCACCKECKECTTGFQKVVDLKNAGLVIYRHTTQTEDLNKDTGIIEFAENTTEDVFILHNTKDMEITLADCLPEIEQNKINCPRCRRIIEHAQKLLKKVPTINRNDAKGVCEHCKMKASCVECEKIIKKFVSIKNERNENTKQRVKLWLSQIKKLLKDVSVDKKYTSKERTRASSELYIDQLCRKASPGAGHAPEVKQIFPPETHGSDFALASSKDKIKQMFEHFPNLEKVDRLDTKRTPRKGEKSSSFKTKGGIHIIDRDQYYSDPDSDDLRALFHPPQPAVSHTQKKERHFGLSGHVMLVPFQSEEDFIVGRDESYKDSIVQQNLSRIPILASRYASDEEIAAIQRFVKMDKTQRDEEPGNRKVYFGVKPGTITADYSSASTLVQKFPKEAVSIKSAKGTRTEPILAVRTSSPYFVRKYHSEEALLTTIDGVTEDDLQHGFIYFFPKEQLAKQKLEHQKSSSELIKDIQDKLETKAEEEKTKLETERKKKKEEETKKLAREERRKELEAKKKADEEGKYVEAEVVKHDKEKKEVISKTDEKDKHTKDKWTPTVSTKNETKSKPEAKEPKVSKEPKEPKAHLEPKAPKERKSPLELKSPKEQKASLELKAPKVRKSPSEPRAPKEPKTPSELKSPKELKAPREPKAPKELKAPPESNAPKKLKSPMETKAPKEPKAPPEPKALKELKAPPESKAPNEPKAPTQPNAPKEPKTPPEPKALKEPKTPPEPKAPKEPKAPPELKAPKELMTPPEPKSLEEPKTPREPKALKEPKAPPEPKAPKEPKTPPEPKLLQEPKNPPEPKASKEPKVAPEPKALKEPKTPPEPNPLQEPKTPPEPKAPKEPKTPLEPKLLKEPKTPPEPKAPTEPKAPPEPKASKEARTPPVPKPLQEPKTPPEPKAPKEPKPPPQPKALKEPKTPPDPKPLREPKTPPEPKAPTEPKAPPEPKAPDEPKTPPEPKLLKEPKTPPEPKAPTEPKEPKEPNADKELLKSDRDTENAKKEIENKLKKEIHQKEQEEHAQNKNDMKQIEKAKQAEKEGDKRRAREEANLKPKIVRDADAVAKTKPEPDKPKALKIVEKTKIKELNINKIKVRNASGDDLILKLVKIKQSKNPDKVRPKGLAEMKLTREDVRNHMCYHNKKHDTCIICLDSDIELDAESIYLRKDEEKVADIILGERIFKYKPPLMEETNEDEYPPLLFKSTFDCAAALPQAQQKYLVSPREETSQVVTKPLKQAKGIEQEVPKGVIRYALSDRSFIDKGWTMLPTEKVVRKMNVYRMRPSHPEFDWFEHNKKKRLMNYDTGEKLAELDDNGRGRWFYRSGRLALDYYDAEEVNAQQRFVIYSNGEADERGRAQPPTILATFDYLGNGIVFDHSGKVRLKYNQTEGIVLDRSIGPVSHWKWHTLNDPPVLQQVMIDTQMAHKDPGILKLGGRGDGKTRPDNEDMQAIEFDNFIKEKSKKMRQKFKPFQIKMKALKINEYFSLRVLDQATVYLLYRDGTTNLKLNIGMILDHKEIVDTDTAEVGDVLNNMERLPALTDSLEALQKTVAKAQRFERTRANREHWLHPAEPCGSADKLRAAVSRPLRPPFRTGPSSTTTATDFCKCSRKPTTSIV